MVNNKVFMLLFKQKQYSFIRFLLTEISIDLENVSISLYLFGEMQHFLHRGCPPGRKALIHYVRIA